MPSTLQALAHADRHCLPLSDICGWGRPHRAWSVHKMVFFSVSNSCCYYYYSQYSVRFPFLSSQLSRICLFLHPLRSTLPLPFTPQITPFPCLPLAPPRHLRRVGSSQCSFVGWWRSVFGGMHQKGGNHYLGTDIEKLRGVGLTGKESQAQNSACVCVQGPPLEGHAQAAEWLPLGRGKEEQGSQGRKETYTVS